MKTAERDAILKSLPTDVFAALMATALTLDGDGTDHRLTEEFLTRFAKDIKEVRRLCGLKGKDPSAPFYVEK